VRAARVLIALASAALWGDSFPTPPAAPPKVLLLTRQQFKSRQAHARERLERAKAAIYNRLDVPVYWLELAAFTGTPEALFFDPFDSFEAVEKASATLGALNEAHPELVRMQAGINDALSSQRAILAVRRDSQGADEINLAQARFMRMLVVRMGPGEEPPSMAGSTPYIIYEVTSGMPSPAFLIFQPMTAFTDIPAAAVTHGTVVEDAVYAVEPDMSHVSREFAGQDREFWMKALQ
jgi:hypothetical protein